MSGLIKTLKTTRLRRYISDDPKTLREGASLTSFSSLLPKKFYSIKNPRSCPKNGEHLTPAEPKEQRPGVLKTYVVYFRQCLQIPLYRMFFLVYLLVNVAINCAGGFTTLFMRETLNIDMDSMGYIYSWTAAISALVFFPAGWLCDRFSPMQVTLAAIVGLCICPILGYVAVNNENSYLAYSLFSILPTVAWSLGSMATAMLLFPQEEFGQFSSGLNVFGCGGLIIGNFLIGVLMDVVLNDYRTAFLWTTVFAGIAILPMLLVIRGWKLHGGPKNYKPPLPD